MPVVTNNTDLRFALVQQPGEGAVRISVERDGRPLSYEDLERMSMHDLSSCKVSSFGMDVKIFPKPKPFSFSRDEYVMSGGPGRAETYFMKSDRAVTSLESFYQLGVAVLTGNI